MDNNFVFQLSQWCNLARYRAQNYVLICSNHQWQQQGRSLWSMCDESCQKNFEFRKGYNVHWLRNCGKQCGDIQLGHHVISCGAEFCAVKRPKLHLQLIVDAVHQGAHSQDLRKQELRNEFRIIAIFEEKCIIYLRNIVHSAAKLSRESTAKKYAKGIAFCRFSTVFVKKFTKFCER